MPAGFDGQHGKETAAAEPPKGFLTKAKYLELFNATRQAVIEATKKLSQSDLDKPTTGPMSQWAPTVGHLLLMTSNHTMMHVGQFTAVHASLISRFCFNWIGILSEFREPSEERAVS